MSNFASSSGVKSLSKASSAKLIGDVTLTGGSNVTLTQSGQDISIAATGSAGATTALDNLASVAINATLIPGVSDAVALGSTTKQWSDLFLAEGAVINFDNGDATITQTGNDITIAGITSFGVGTSTAVTLGTIELGAASDTTLARVSAGVISVEGITLVDVSSTQALTNKTYNGNTFTAGTGVLTIAAAKTLTISNSLTLAGTDGKGINVGAATSGKILIGDGTNMVLSTSTIPTSAGATAGKILVSDATNYVLSTPTFPNASATSGKVIKSDGTNWVASTETYAAPGTSGNVLTSDGTNWTSAAAAGGGGGYVIPAYGYTTNANVTSATRYFGGLGTDGDGFSWNGGDGTTHAIYIPKTGTITQVYGRGEYYGTNSSDSWSIYIRLNNTTDTTVSTTFNLSAALNAFSATGLSTAVTAGNYINVKAVTPASYSAAPNADLSFTLMIYVAT